MGKCFGKKAVLAAAAGFMAFAAIWAYRGITISGPGDRPEAAIQEPEDLQETRMTILLAGVDDTGLLADVILLARYDGEGGNLHVLQVPRDTFVGERYTTGKINAAYGFPPKGMDGMDSLERELEKMLQLPIDYHASITLAGFRGVVDSLGGIPMDVPFRLEYLPGMVLEPGSQVLSGEQSEWLVRYRQGYAMGDLGRLDMQKAFLNAAVKAVKDKGRLEVFSAVMENYGQLKTNLPLAKAMSFSKALLELEPEDLQFYTVPGTGARYDGYAVYQVNRFRLAEILDEAFRTEGEQVSPWQLPIGVVPEETEASSLS